MTAKTAASRPDTRSKIVETAARLFSAHGFAGTSIRDIACELCVTKAALYYHFSSKEEILKAIIAQPFDAVREVLERDRPLATPEQRAGLVRDVITAMANCKQDSVRVFKDPSVVALVDAEVSTSGVTHALSVRLAMGMADVQDPDDVPPAVLMRAIAAVGAGYEAITTWHVVYPEDEGFTPEGIEEIVGLVTDVLEAPQRVRR